MSLRFVMNYNWQSITFPHQLLIWCIGLHSFIKLTLVLMIERSDSAIVVISRHSWSRHAQSTEVVTWDKRGIIFSVSYLRSRHSHSMEVISLRIVEELLLGFSPRHLGVSRILMYDYDESSEGALMLKLDNIGTALDWHSLLLPRTQSIFETTCCSSHFTCTSLSSCLSNESAGLLKRNFMCKSEGSSILRRPCPRQTSFNPYFISKSTPPYEPLGQLGCGPKTPELMERNIHIIQRSAGTILSALDS